MDCDKYVGWWVFGRHSQYTKIVFSISLSELLMIEACSEISKCNSTGSVATRSADNTGLTDTEDGVSATDSFVTDFSAELTAQ